MNKAMRFSPISTPEGLAALETLQQLGFKLDSTGTSHRLLRPDGSQVQVYHLDGKHSVSGNVGNITDFTRSEAAILALVVARASLADQAARAHLPRFQNPSIAKAPYG